jgi:hypothetical protein
MMNKITHITWLIICCLILFACDSTPKGNQPKATNPTNPSGLDPSLNEVTPENFPGSNENNPTSEPTRDRTERLTVTVLPEKINPADLPESNPIIGEVPDEILQAIIKDLVQRTDADQQDIQVIRSESVTWSDGSLGCPKPGEVYTQVLVDGYWVVLQVDEVAYDYRASQSGYFKLCEGSGLIPVSPPGSLPPDK